MVEVTGSEQAIKFTGLKQMRSLGILHLTEVVLIKSKGIFMKSSFENTIARVERSVFLGAVSVMIFTLGLLFYSLMSL